MATIQSSIRLQDQMSSPLQRITDAIDRMTASWEDAQDGFRNGANEYHVSEIRRRLQESDDEIQEMIRHQNQYNNSVVQGTNAIGGMLSKLGGLVGAYVGMQAVKSAIDYASDLTEVQNVVDVSFGESASAVDDWAKTTLNAFGINELSAKQFAGTMGAMLKSSGLAGDSVAEMSMRIAEMSGDMASFYNLDPAEAFAKIRSGISGETEPLKQLGINMSVANLEAFALSQGMTKAYNKMSQAEQVQLRYNYLLNATKDAQGDFTRTAGSFANQQKLLTENWKAFTGELATNALPVLAMGIRVLNQGINAIRAHWSVIAPLLTGAIGIVATYGAVWLALQIPLAVATIKQWALNNAILACPAFWLVAVIIALIAVTVSYAQSVAEASDTVQSAFGVIAGSINYVWALLQNFGIFVMGVLTGIVNAVSAIGLNIKNAFYNATENAKVNLHNMGVFITNIAEGIRSVFDAISLNLTNAFYNATENAKVDFNNVGIFISNVAEGIRSVFTAVTTNIGIAFNNAKIISETALYNLSTRASNIADAIGLGFSTLVNNIKGAFFNGISEIEAKFYDLLGTVADVAYGMAEAISKIPFVGDGIDLEGFKSGAEGFRTKAENLRSGKAEIKDVGAVIDSKLNEWTAQEATGLQNFNSIGDAWKNGFGTNPYQEYGTQRGFNSIGDAWKNGFGTNPYKNYSVELGYWNVGNQFTNSMNSYLKQNPYLDPNEAYKAGTEWGDGVQNDLMDKWNKFVSPELPEQPQFDDIQNALDQIQGNTGGTSSSAKAINDSLNKSIEDLKYLRDIVEQEVINRFTTAEIKVDLGGVTNNVSSNMDLDGMVDYLTTSLQESMESVAEGVYVA